MHEKVKLILKATTLSLSAVIILLASYLVWNQSGTGNHLGINANLASETASMTRLVEQFEEEQNNLEVNEESQALTTTIVSLRENIQRNTRIQSYYQEENWTAAYQLEVDKLNETLLYNEGLDNAMMTSLKGQLATYNELIKEDSPYEDEFSNPPALLFSLTFFESLMPFFFSINTILLCLYLMYTKNTDSGLKAYVFNILKLFGNLALVFGLPFLLCTVLNGLGSYRYPIVTEVNGSFEIASNGSLVLKSLVIQSLIILAIACLCILFKELGFRWSITFGTLLAFLFGPSFFFHRLALASPFIGYYPFTYYEALFSVKNTLNNTFRINTVTYTNGIMSLSIFICLCCVTIFILKRRTSDDSVS